MSKKRRSADGGAPAAADAAKGVADVDVDAARAADAKDWVAPPEVHKATSQKRGEPRRAGAVQIANATLGAVDALDVDSVVCGWCSDVRPLGGALGMIDWRLCGRVSRLLERGTFSGAADERVLMPTHGRIPAPRLFLFGFGPSTSLSSSAPARIAAMAQMAKKAGARRVAVSLPEPCGAAFDALVDVVAAEFFGARYARTQELTDGSGARAPELDVDALVVFGADPFPPL